MPASNPEQEIARHYTHGSLLQTILDTLKSTGIDPDHPAADDLSAVDEFHTGGRAATVEFAEQMGVVPGHLLDVGSGVGGPSRYFASHHGCAVTGVDLSEEFCETAKALSSRTGLADKTEYRQGSVTSLPFENATFDGAYMLHVGMNLPDKNAVFREVARVLKPGAVFGIFDIMREAEGELQFPVPWAQGPDASFVESSAKYQELLGSAGFAIEKQRNRRELALDFFAKRRAAAVAAASSNEPTPLGLPILMGPSAPLKLGNLMGMIERGLLCPVELISRKSLARSENAQYPAPPTASAATQNGNSDQRMYPALSKNRVMEIGDTWIGLHGRNSRASENGNQSITPNPPSVMASSSGCVIAQPAHRIASFAAVRRECPRLTNIASPPANRHKKNGEWKNPRCPQKLS